MAIEQRTESRRRKTRPPAELFKGAATALRPISPTDLPILKAWDNDPEIVALMGRKFSTESADDWYRSLEAGKNCRALAIETTDGKLIGELELAQLNWRLGSTELRICIGDKEFRGRGFGMDVMAATLRLAFEGYGLNNVYLRVFISNVRAIRLYERAGFRREAVLEPSVRRGDPAPVLLMTLQRERWLRMQGCTA